MLCWLKLMKKYVVEKTHIVGKRSTEYLDVIEKVRNIAVAFSDKYKYFLFDIIPTSCSRILYHIKGIF